MVGDGKPKQPRRGKAPHAPDLLLSLLRVANSSAKPLESAEAISEILRTWLGCSSVTLKYLRKGTVDSDSAPFCLLGATNPVTTRGTRNRDAHALDQCNSSSLVDCLGRRLLARNSFLVPGIKVTPYGSLWINDISAISKSQTRGKNGRPLACYTGSEPNSVMLIPLKHGDSILGLIEAADEKRDCFTQRSVAAAEEIARFIPRTWEKDSGEEKYRAIFEGAGVGLVEEDFSAVKEYLGRLDLLDRHGLSEYFDENPDDVTRCARMVIVKDVNKAAVDMYGATAKEDLVSDCRFIFAEEAIEAFKRLTIALSQGQTRFHTNAITRNLKGELKQLSLAWYVSPAYEENWSRIVCSVEDITERTRAVDRLNEQLLFFQTLIDTVPTPIFYKDTEQRYLGCNRAFEKYSRTTKQDIIGKTVFDLLGDVRKARIHHLADGELLRYPGRRLYESSIDHVNGKRSTNIHRKATFVRPDGTSAGIVGVIMDITEQKIAEDRLRKSQEELRNLSRRLQYVREEERKAISREIHDQLGQTLTVLQMEIALLTRKVPSSEKGLIDKAKKLKNRVREAIEIVRSISARTRPEMLDDLGLAAAMEWQISEFQNLTGLNCDISIDQTEKEIEADLSTALFRILQEALTNVWHHAHATDVRVSLQRQEGILALEVHDNGRGITEKQANDSTSTGLIGMRERVYPWAGKVAIEGHLNTGTTVRVTVPLKATSGMS
jgi:PAS domain S-box-containing protein